MKLLTILNEDVRAKARWLYGTDERRAVLKAWLTDGTAAMVLYRLMQWSHTHRLGPLAMLFNKLNGVFCHCIIGRGASFGSPFVLIHSDGVVINAGVQGGDGIHLEHQVTIGAEKGTAPRLGDRIFVGAGAKLIGAIHVGDDVRVGANAVVIRDVPASHTAVGVPAVAKPRDLEGL
jgi:serine O-acetyltransferase